MLVTLSEQSSIHGFLLGSLALLKKPLQVLPGYVIFVNGTVCCGMASHIIPPAESLGHCNAHMRLES